MNRRLIGVLVFAFLISAGASFLIYRVITARLASEPKAVTNRLLVAARSLPVGTLLKDLDVKTVDWPMAIPANAVTKQEDAVGRGVITDIYEGEPILESRLAPKGAGAGLAAIIPQGKRAVAIRVNDVTAVAGFVIPGTRVDILILGTPPNAPPTLGTQTKTLLQNMEVLSAGQQIQKDAEGKPVSVPVVNVLVTPEQAEVLSLASQDARIQLVLRNPLDTDEAKPPGTALARLWGAPPPPPKPASGQPRAARSGPPPPRVAQLRVADRPPERIVVEVIHGTIKNETKFERKQGSEEK